jgi:hypothetical protein
MIVSGCFNPGNQSLENGHKGNGVHHQRMSNERNASIENIDLTRLVALEGND